VKISQTEEDEKEEEITRVLQKTILEKIQITLCMYFPLIIFFNNDSLELASKKYWEQ
jgi:hypothetical protein